MRGDEPLRLVWAAVYPPSFEEPDYTTLELGVPLIELESDPEQEPLPGQALRYTANYNGFVEPGEYRVVVYAEDQTANQAYPVRARMGAVLVYLPVMWR
jgi:hypothetical protein